jgi:radical SAM protein with 4Fe4S-binding SPASM domain
VVGEDLPLWNAHQGSADEKLVRSRYVQTAGLSEGAVAWHSLFGSPQVLSPATLEVLGYFDTSHTIADLSSEYELEADAGDVLGALRTSHFLVPENYDERSTFVRQGIAHAHEAAIGRGLHSFSFVMAETCNFACRYCMHFKNLAWSSRGARPRVMTPLDGVRYATVLIDFLRSADVAAIELNFGGGEPLLAWPAILAVLEYCSTRRGDVDVSFSINTNAALITPEIAECLAAHRVQVASSLDGPRRANDLVRRTAAGDPTYDAIRNGHRALREVGYPLTGFSVTLDETNWNLVDEGFVEWAGTEGFRDLRVDVDVTTMPSVSLEEVVSRLMRLKTTAAGYGLTLTGFWERPIENMNESPLETSVAFCGAMRGNGLCVNPAGDLYICGYSTTLLGHISRIQECFQSGSSYHRVLKENAPGAQADCTDCSIEGPCGGGCLISREFASKEQNAGLNRRCEFYRRMSKELLVRRAEAFETVLEKERGKEVLRHEETSHLSRRTAVTARPRPEHVPEEE